MYSQVLYNVECRVLVSTTQPSTPRGTVRLTR